MGELAHARLSTCRRYNVSVGGAAPAATGTRRLPAPALLQAARRRNLCVWQRRGRPGRVAGRRPRLDQHGHPLGELALRRTTSWITAVLETVPSPLGDGTHLFIAPGVDPSHLVNTVR